MTATLYFNQYANGGAIEREGWEAFNADDLDVVYGSAYSLRTATVELPDGWHIANVGDTPKLVDSTGHIVFFGRNCTTEKIYVSNGDTPCFQRLHVIEVTK